MTRFSSFLLTALLILLPGCGKKTPPPPRPVEPEPIGVQPTPADKDKVVAKDREPTGNPPPDPAIKGAYTRDQFRALIGKTSEEVLRRLGPPDRKGNDLGDEYWFYDDRTKNDDGTIDERSNLTLQNGIVKRVFFKPRD